MPAAPRRPWLGPFSVGPGPPPSGLSSGEDPPGSEERLQESLGCPRGVSTQACSPGGPGGLHGPHTPYTVWGRFSLWCPPDVTHPSSQHKGPEVLTRWGLPPRPLPRPGADPVTRLLSSGPHSRGGSSAGTPSRRPVWTPGAPEPLPCGTLASGPAPPARP